MNNKEIKAPIADHGLHRHDINNVPVLGTLKFFEPIPFAVKEFQKSESINLNSQFFNRAVIPLNDPAMVTGKINVRGFYVPKQLIFKGWHDFDQKIQHTYSDGTSAYISTCRYVNDDLMSTQFLSLSTLVSTGNSSNYDIKAVDSGGIVQYYLLSELGHRVQKVFNALGYSFTWDCRTTPRTSSNIMKVLGYIKVMLDHYSPKQYANVNSQYLYAKQVLEADTVSSLHVDELHVINMVAHYSFCFYESSIFDIAFDTPVGPNSFVNDISINDPTSTNTLSVVQNSVNGTPEVNISSTNRNITQYVINALNNVTNFMLRHRLAGGRLAENFLLSRGIRLSKDQLRESYYLGSFSAPLQVSDIENNSDTNLGELAGKMTGSSKDLHISFKQTFDDDGYFYIITSIVPDCTLPVFNDPDNYCIYPLDFFHGEYDKQGPVNIPQSVVYFTNDALKNISLRQGQFGFLNQYWHRCLFPPRLFGDFRVPSRAGNTYDQYHTFRDLTTFFGSNSQSVNHCYDFLRTQLDYMQYDRLFNASKADPFMLLMQFNGNMMLKKLPLGDSYDWNDDEFNQKAQIVASGNVN